MDISAILNKLIQHKFSAKGNAQDVLNYQSGVIDAIDFLKGDNVLIYIDPPYLVNTKLATSSQLYKHNFTIEDHKKLAKDIKVCKHKVIISYDDDEDGFIRSLYDGFNIYEEQWTYCGSSSGKNQSKKKKVGKELIITNFKSETVFDLFAKE